MHSGMRTFCVVTGGESSNILISTEMKPFSWIGFFHSTAPPAFAFGDAVSFFPDLEAGGTP